MAAAVGAALAALLAFRRPRGPLSTFAADSILDGMTEALLVLDRDGAVRLANRAAGELFAAPAHELLARPIDTLLQQPRGTPATPIRQLLATAPSEHEVTLRRSPTDVRTLSVSLSPIRHEGQEAEAIACFVRDVTERKRAEKRLNYTNHLLLQHQRELFDALVSTKKTNEELKSTQMQLMQAAKLESIGRLAAGVAHEVKNPLAIILMGVEYLAHALNGNAQAVMPVLNDIGEAVRRADGVIRGMLDFSAPKELQLQPAEINRIITQSVELVRHALTQRHVTVVTELAETLPPLQLDPNKMKQVFVNLFMNAVDAMAEGGMLTIRSDIVQLTTVGEGVGRRETDRFRIGDTVVVVDVADTGCGIPDAHLSKLFEPFFTTKPTGQGTGLGLAVTKTILELHGGLIDVRNRPEGGALVRLRLKPETVDG